MNHTTDAEEYEKSFLERYFRAQAKKKLEKLNEKIENSKTTSQRSALLQEKQEILNELEINLESIKGTENAVDKNENNVPQPTTVVAERQYKGYSIRGEIWNILFEYQRKGVEWMLDLYTNGTGGILADEMGLGKTIQAISFLSAINATGKPKNVYIVCPATIVSHWLAELHKYAPEISTINDCPQSVSSPSYSQRYCVVSYESFKRKYKGEKIDVLVLDEGHKIKNKDAHITQILKSVPSHARFVLTGTPIQNNLGELWSLIDFVAPGLLGSYSSFYEEFEERIRNRKEPDSAYRYSTMLRAVIEPHILRRMKTEVAQNLPQRADNVIFVALTPQQEALYIRALDSKYIRRAITDKGSLLGAIDHLRKICNHPLLLSSTADLVSSSCKIIALIEMLNKWKIEGSRVLVFTQTVQMQRILERVLLQESFSFLKLSGKVAVSSRCALIERFNTDSTIGVFLLTTRVGGLGLNLTSANRIVLYDPDWNPSTDSQAKERVHRYGQRSAVETYRLICKNTLEEKIYQRQIYKDCLTKKILSNPRIKFSHESFFDLFDYRASNGTETEIRPHEVYTVDKSVLKDVREEDRANFELLKGMNGKKMLSGTELIEYIERRELSLM